MFIELKLLFNSCALSKTNFLPVMWDLRFSHILLYFFPFYMTFNMGV